MLSDIHHSTSQYRSAAHYNVTHRRRQNFYALPSAQWQMLAAPPFDILSKFDAVDDAIDANADIALEILESAFKAFGVTPEPSGTELGWRGTAKAADMEKVRITIRQFYRDWSKEGAAEREACYGPILADLDRLFVDVEDKGKIRVLVPGAGLGRLVLEVCKSGYTVEGNEISFHQLMASNWILNQVEPGETYELYPSALTFSNHISRGSQLRAVTIPDIHPAVELNKSSAGKKTHALQRMGMAAADFSVHYAKAKQRGSFHAVTTAFFIDTAPNVVRYIEAIYNTLRNGGFWINVGPLLWHFEERAPGDRGETPTNNGPALGDSTQEGIGAPGSVELTNEEMLLLVERMGFKIELQEIKSEGFGYIQDPGSMVQSSYRLSHFVAKKVA